MKYRLFHLNILKGRLLGRLIPYLLNKQYDFLNLQEVAGGKMGFDGRDSFTIIKNALGYDGRLIINEQTVGDEQSYSGNAMFFKKSIAAGPAETLWLKKFRKITDATLVQDYPHALMSQIFKLNGKPIQIINCHLAWGPTPKDKKFKLIQGRRLVEYVKKIRIPFVLSGDFNLTADSRIVKALDRLVRNLTVETKIPNTLNGHIHRIKRLFPKGLAVDFVFVSKSIRVKKFQLVDKPDLSDHYGLALEFEI
jgi:endonuclease/exonuclease/phosphatase family metal-dependent hydrolase